MREVCKIRKIFNAKAEGNYVEEGSEKKVSETKESSEGEEAGQRAHLLSCVDAVFSDSCGEEGSPQEREKGEKKKSVGVVHVGNFSIPLFCMLAKFFLKRNKK